jgi:CxxC motif-containing protein (DUF1111 family)
VIGGRGADGLATVLRVGHLTGDGFDPLLDRGGPVARTRSVAELGIACRLTPGIPAGANVTSVRNSPPLFGLGLIDTIPDDAILAGAIDHDDGVHGRPNIVRDPDANERVGRFGWKAATASLERFVAEAFRNELGITSRLAAIDSPAPASDPADRCAGESDTPEDDGVLVEAVSAYVASLPAPRPVASGSTGESVFQRTGCASCHTPSLPAAGGDIRLYTDLLLHDMGPALDDAVVQESAAGRDWRTTPLWGLSSRARFLHDGRARTLRAAILAHDGEAAHAVARFRELAGDELDELMTFLASL